MTSLRHNNESAKSSEDQALDAAREAILAVGWSRTTLTDIARRAGLSRMTLYRRWPEMNALLGDLMTREWTSLVDLQARATPPADHRDRLVEAIVSTIRALRTNELFTRIIELDPQMLLPYLLERPGRSQELVLGLLVNEIEAGQQADQIRAGNPRLLARSVLLAAHGFTLSAQTMLDEDATAEDFDAELAVLVTRYLA
jgi:AcrR family transcriptional regulator